MIFTRSGRGNIDFRNEIESKISAGKVNELLLIVPTNRKSRFLKREIITKSPGGTASSINIETLGTFSKKLVDETASASGRLLSDAASSILLKQSFSRQKLHYFASYKNDIPAGTIERIKNVLSEYKRHGITPEMIKKEAENLTGSERVKALDIASVYEEYNRLGSSLNVKETGDIYRALNDISPREFDAAFRNLYPDVQLIAVDGFDEFTVPEIEIISSAAAVPGTEIFLSLDYYGLNENIFSHLDKCYSSLLAKNFSIIENQKSNEDNSFRKEIREKLFTGSPAKIKGYNLSEIEAPSREKEVEYIAKEIKALINSGTTEPDGICVVFNLIKNYSSLIRDIFPQYGIPFNLSDRKSLSLSLPVVSIINFLEILENDFYYKNIFRALSSGFISIENISPAALYAASVKLRIISGYSNWVSMLKEADIRNTSETDRSGAASMYKKAYESIISLNNFLSPFSRKMSVVEFRNELKKIIFSLQIHSAILNNRQDNTEENIKGLTVFLNTLDELFELLYLEEGEKKFPLKYYLNNLRTAVTGTRFNIKEKSGYGVLVTNLNEIRGLKFENLFIGGLCDGDLPTRYTPEIFNSGTYVKNEKNHQTEERYLFYQALCSWTNRLFLSFPKTDGRKELVKSNFLGEFESLFAAEKTDESSYSSRIYSNEELLFELGSGTRLETEAVDKERISELINIDNNRKMNPFGDSEFTGRILNRLDNISRKALEDYCRREFSVSQLELYAKCPFKYFAERVLNLNTVEEPTEEIEARELGSLLHNILYRFYTELSESGVVLKGADREQFKSAENILFRIAGEEISAASFSPLSFFEKEKILGINGRRQDSILYRFLITETEAEDDYQPSYFEVTFGNFPAENKDKGEVLQDFKAGDVKVRGKIDRIDIDRKGEKFKVIDYKSGTGTVKQKDLETGISLQLPLYLIAARELIRYRLGRDFLPAGGEIYSLKYNEKDFRKHTVIKEHDKMAESCIEVIEKYVNSMKKGNFNLSELEAREDMICRYCTFRTICRIDEAG